MAIITTTVIVLILTSLAPAAAAQDTRAEEARARREAKSRQLQPAQHSGIERLLYKIEEDTLVERILAPPRGVYLRFGGIGEGAGFGAGPGIRYSKAQFD